jgi:glycosyltransferase involved in cell wall biosynthesis
MDAPGLSIFFPCYNDERTIGALVERADAIAAAFTRDYELIVVDDGSRDGSAAVLAALAARLPRLRVLTHEHNQGYGAALRSGFRAAGKDWVFYTDGDGQYDVADLRPMLARIGEDVDLVNGYRSTRIDPPHRLLIGRLYQWAMRRLFGFRLRDLSCDFRLIRRRTLAAVDLRCNSGAICIELVRKLELAGCRTLDCPVPHYARPHGASEFFRPHHLWATATEIAGLWRELRRRTHAGR